MSYCRNQASGGDVNGFLVPLLDDPAPALDFFGVVGGELLLTWGCDRKRP